MDLTLVVMAAGIGSRFGGIKQMEPIGPNGEMIIDYSVYDAIKAGFNRIVFIIREDIESDFKSAIGDRLAKFIDVEYVFQNIDNLPKGIDYPSSRKKPWGTGHAVFCARDKVEHPFAVINADDFYGETSFEKIADHLRNMDNSSTKENYCMVGFDLHNTLSENGHVSRGVCITSESGHLKDITEYTKIRKNDGNAEYSFDGDSWHMMDDNIVVSMNMWGFSPRIFDEIEEGMSEFFKENMDKLDTIEYYLPYVVDKSINQNKSDVTVLECSEKWYGITYKEDKQAVQDAVADMIDRNVYPKKLWNM